MKENKEDQPADIYIYIYGEWFCSGEIGDETEHSPAPKQPLLFPLPESSFSQVLPKKCTCIIKKNIFAAKKENCVNAFNVFKIVWFTKSFLLLHQIRELCPD
ncbi:MAG: hypothetical protein IJX44_07170 [Bacteroidaceae bacterium]|nr:hypothetical protein [Bacteroidaceae bacterium]